MPIEIMMVRQRFGLAFASGFDEEALAHIPVGKQLKCSISRGKSNDQMRFLWSLVGKVAKGTGYADSSVLMDELQIRTGFIDSLQFRNGEVHARPRGLSTMDDETFRAFVDAAKHLLITEYLPAGRDGERVVEEAWAMLGLSGGGR